MANLESRAERLIEGHDDLLRALIGLRVKHKLTQSDVALRMGVTQPTVSNFESYDANPTLATVRRYALAVDAMIYHQVKDDCVTRATDYTTAKATGRVVWAPAANNANSWFTHFHRTTAIVEVPVNA